MIPEPETTTPDAPGLPPESTPFTPEWFAVQLAANEALVQQHFARMTATQEYQQWQQVVGGLNTLRQLAKMTEAQG